MGPLETYLPYLLNRAGARIAEAFSKDVRPLGATLQMWRVLAALRDRGGSRMGNRGGSRLGDRGGSRLGDRGGSRMGDLSATTSIEVSTLTRLVDSMEKKGLVARRSDPADARAIVLHATAAGRKLTRRILPIAERYEKLALRGLDAAATDQLKAALRRVYANIRDRRGK